MAKPLKLSDLTEKSKQWVLMHDVYKKFTIEINLVHGIPFFKYGIYKIETAKEPLCIMLTSSVTKALLRYNAINELNIISQYVDVDEELT